MGDSRLRRRGVRALLAAGITLAGAGTALLALTATGGPASAAPGAAASTTTTSAAATPPPARKTLADGTVVILGPNGNTIAAIAPATSIGPPATTKPAPTPSSSLDAISIARDPLASTGRDTGLELALGAGLLAAGAALTVLGTQRRAH